jgi:hypothetical protein
MYQVQNFKMPEGIVSIRNVDLGVGPCLEVTLTTGHTILIDCLKLDGVYAAQIGVYETSKYEKESDIGLIDGLHVASLE